MAFLIRGAALLGAGGVVLSGSGCGETRADGGPAKVTTVLGEVGLSPGQFTYPRCLDADESGLWVIDKAANIQRVDPKTGNATAFWQLPDFQAGKPCGLTVGPDGLMYVADTHYFRVVVYKPPALDGAPPGRGGAMPRGEVVAEWGSYGEGPGQFIYLTDVAVLAGKDGKVERYYVSEYGGNDRVSAFDAEHRFLFSFGTFGTGEDPAAVEFNRPQSIAVDGARGVVVVADACNHRLGVFTLEGKLVKWIGSAGEGPEQFGYPYGLALRPDFTALVAEFGNHRVHHIDLETGKTLGLHGRPGRGRGEFTNPWAVAVLDETVYVLDSGNARIEGFRAPRLVRKGAG